MLVLLSVTACTKAPMESHPSPKRLIEAPEKREVPNSFFTGSTIVQIEEEKRAVEVMNWYDNETVLFLQEHMEGSALQKHHLFSGQSSVFYEVNGWILDVVANVDYSRFALSVLNYEEETEIVIINSNGNVELTIKDFGEDYSIFWNEYEPSSFIMTAYLPNWDYETYFVDVETEKIKQINLEQSYIQWTSPDTVAYLKWEELEPNFQAPLYQVNVNTGESSLWKEDVIAYMSFPDGMSLSISVDSDYDLYSLYKFYDQQEMYRQIEVPILNTYSEQWWIPYYTYNKENRIFYYLRPKASGDFISYQDGYDLIAYNIDADSEVKLTTLERHVPIAISPGGSSLLVGDRFQQVLDIDERILVPIWEE
jgi:hypothetical protein